MSKRANTGEGPAQERPEFPDVPAECKLLDAAYRASELTASDLAVAAGMSVGSVRIALSGVRYRTGKREIVPPPDRTLAKLASVLGLAPAKVASVGRERAAALMTDAKRTPPSPLELESVAAIAAREELARRVLGAFSADELQAELDRRQRLEHDELDREAERDLAETLRTEQWPL